MLKNQPKEQVSQEAIIINKQREIQNDSMIQDKWREARSHFYTHLIKQKLNSSKVHQNRHKQILTLFVRAKQDQDGKLQINFDNLGKLNKCFQQIAYLKQIFQQIQTSFIKQAKECLPLAQAIKLKLNNLRIIQIQYQANANLYYISAFELFKVVHDNKNLMQVTLKGVQVQEFEQFITIFKSLRTLKRSKTFNQEEQHNWIKSFNPLKSLKLSINAKIQFQMKSRQETNCKLNNLTFFGAVFNSLSDITVSIGLGQWVQTNDWKNTLQDLFTVLAATVPHYNLDTVNRPISHKNDNKYREDIFHLTFLGSADQNHINWDKQSPKYQPNFNLKKIKLIIEGSTQQIPVELLRSVLFAGLASFKQIAQLSLKNISFNTHVGLNDMLAIEQSLITIFLNNNITYLKLYHCENFPIFPKITTLQQLDLNGGSFRKKFSIIKECIKINPQLRCISCWGNDEQWLIDEPLLNQLQNLATGYCQGVTLGSMSQSPSNIRQLEVFTSSIGNFGCLSALIPKLVNLTYLNLYLVQFGDQFLCAIPSPHLQKLQILFNFTITDRGLERIDQKWPNLRSFTIGKCKNITTNVWTNCKFKGLMQLRIDKDMLKKKKDFLDYLKNRGIKVYY